MAFRSAGRYFRWRREEHGRLASTSPTCSYDDEGIVLQDVWFWPDDVVVSRRDRCANLTTESSCCFRDDGEPPFVQLSFWGFVCCCCCLCWPTPPSDTFNDHGSVITVWNINQVLNHNLALIQLMFLTVCCQNYPQCTGTAAYLWVSRAVGWCFVERTGRPVSSRLTPWPTGLSRTVLLLRNAVRAASGVISVTRCGSVTGWYHATRTFTHSAHEAHFWGKSSSSIVLSSSDQLIQLFTLFFFPSFNVLPPRFLETLSFHKAEECSFVLVSFTRFVLDYGPIRRQSHDWVKNTLKMNKTEATFTFYIDLEKQIVALI